MGLALLLLLVLIAPAAAQEPEFAARLASAVAAPAAQASTPPVVVAIEPSEQAGLGEQAARWLRVEQFLWAELARGATVVPVLPGGEAPRLRLRTAASGLPKGFMAQWRLHDAASGRLLQSDSARWGELPPPPAAETALSTPAPMALATPPAVMTVMSWLDQPLLAGILKAPFPAPLWVGGAALSAENASGAAAWVSLRDKPQKWEGSFEVQSWVARRHDPVVFGAVAFAGTPVLTNLDSDARVLEFRFTGSRALRVPFGLGVPGVAWLDFPLFLKAAAGVGLQYHSANIRRTFVVGGPGSTPGFTNEHAAQTRPIGTVSLMLGKRFRQDFELLGGPDLLVGRTQLDPANIQQQWRWSIRAQLRLF
ncbi:MAG: hypothetical protein HY928_14075 [Elusimicrobia bacterium]|nr:hypothetical protein [Elusimicrobiota bacterium]